MYRRSFIKTSLAATACTPSIIKGANTNSNIQHACIGVGGMMGYNDYKNISSHSNTKIVAICDVGAYGMSLSSNYNLRPKLIELLIKGSKIKIIRNRQKYKDLI